MAMALVLGMAQCKKQETPEAPSQDLQWVTITMKMDEGNKHEVFPSTGAVVYTNGDKIYVSNGGLYRGVLTFNNGAFTGDLAYNSENPMNTNDKLHFYFLGGSSYTEPTSLQTTQFEVNISNQSSNLPVLSCGQSTQNYTDGTATYSCTLENQCGLVKFVISSSVAVPINISGMKTTATIDFATPSITPTNTTGEVTLFSTSGTEKWAILLPQDAVTAAAATAQGFYNGATFAVPAITANSYLNMGITMNPLVPDGAINGLFTVGMDGNVARQVYFSKGNLQFIPQYYDHTWHYYWKFADYQWEYLGNNGQGSTNQNVARDLFGWGTSGYNHGATAYQPWSTSTNNYDYCAYGQYNYNLNQEGQSGQADWGYNAISNGGNAENIGWRTLLREEWDYVINTRTTTSGIRYAKGTVNGVIGLILLPDNWDASTYTLNNTNTSGASFDGNIISSGDWTTTLEPHGAVFLPAAGLRDGTSVNSVGERGYYWSSTHEHLPAYGYYYFAYNMHIYSNEVAIAYTIGRSDGLAVRLVR